MKINNRLLIVDDDRDIHADFYKILSPFRFTHLDRELANIERRLFDEQRPEPSPSSRVEYEIDNAYRADAALKMILQAKEEGRPYAVVFTDVRIPPGIDGVQLVRKILQQAPQTQVVIVTAFSDYSWEEMTQFFGWTDRLLILRKPVDPITVKQVALMLTRKWTSELDLRNHRAHLESMVEKRTEKLMRTNQRLEQEIHEREKAEAALKQAHASLADANDELQHEIRQRKQTEEQLRVLLGDLEAANKELENFAYIVSHDLKAPLRAISSIASWLAEDFQNQLGKRGDDYLHDLQDQTRWMHNLVEGILEYSRLGRAKYELKYIHTQGVVQRLLEFLLPESMEGVIVGTLPDVVYDRTHLEQIFQNLIGNAVQHMGRPTGKIRIDCKTDDDFFTFSVTDNGIGIEERHFERIFKVFQTLKPREESEQSTGIGLSLVRRIAERHGGSIWVKSKVGEGSIFTFTISRHLKPQALARGHSVVVIDDNVDFCAIAETLLKRAGHYPIHVSSGQEAQQLLATYNGELDLALLDLNLPGENVLQLYRSLKQLRPDMRFLVCTGEPDSEQAHLLQQMGVDGMLAKPFNIEELSAALSATLG